MTIEIEIPDNLTAALAELIGTENTRDAIGRYYSDFIASALASHQVSKEFNNALELKTAEIKSSITVKP